MQVKHSMILLILFLSCNTVFSQDENKYTLFEQAGYQFPYQLNEPNNTWKLPEKLVEISGLSFIDSNRLACVQDEKGNVYIFNLTSEKVESKVNFWDQGDFEGVEIIDDDVWVLKSNGTLYKVSDFLKEKTPHVTKYATVLSGKNDTEGLAYDPINRSLLIACKGHPFIDDKKGKEFKALYNFNLETNQIDPTPYLLIEMDTIKYYKNYNTMAQMGVELLAFFDHSKGDVSFQPSALAIHPITGNIYILGSVGHILLVFSREGELLSIIKLRSKIFRQPEGICFSPDGILYIASEGDGIEGKILKFEPK